MKAVVTGGAGFIGSHVVDRILPHVDSLVILDNLSTGRLTNLAHIDTPFRFIECDIRSPGDWMSELEGADWVLHLAALADIVPSIQNPSSYFETNVVGTFNVLQAASSCGVERFVYAASSSCYGIPDEYPTPETAEIRPEYPYALTKRMGEELVLHWSQVYGLSAMSLRLFNVYGTRSRTSGTYGAVFGVFLAQKLAGVPLTIVGDGNQTRDFTYVSDVAEAFFVAAQSDLSGIALNVGSGATISVNTIATLLGGETVSIPKRPGEPDSTFADITAITSLLGWSPTVPIEFGAELVKANIEYWRDAPVWTPESIADATSDWFRYLGQRK